MVSTCDLFGIGLLITMTLVFQMNMGFGALMIGLALGLMAPSKQNQILKQMPWSVMIMVTGIMTYVGVYPIKVRTPCHFRNG